MFQRCCYKNCSLGLYLSPLLLLLLLLLSSFPSSTTAATKHASSSSSSSTTPTCTAGLIFLKTFDKNHNHNHHPNSIHHQNPLPISNSTSSSNTSSASSSTTYTLQLSYPCSTSPLPKIEKLKKSIPDPFVSFYLTDKPATQQSSSLKPRPRRSPKQLLHHHNHNNQPQEYGSGNYDDDDEDDDDDDDDEEDEEDEEDSIHNHHHHEDNTAGNNEIIDLYPSSHVMVLLPTPTIQYEDQYNRYNSTFTEPASYPPPSASSVIITPSTTTIQYQQQSTPVLSSSPQTPPHSEDDLLLFPPSGTLGSGDGPILSTPLYYHSSEAPTTTTDRFVYISSSSSSSSPTPSLTHHLLHPIKKQLLYSGSPSTYNIPSNTFHPPCSEYELADDTYDFTTWIQITNKSLAHFFPTKSHISDYNVRVRCVNTNAIAEMFVSVRQRQRSRLHNHEFSLEFGMIRGDYGRVELLNKIVQEIRSALHSTAPNDLVVLSTELECYPFRLSYVNESIISNVCPIPELKQIYTNLQNVNGFIKLEQVMLHIPPDNNQCDSSVIATVTGITQHPHQYGENYPPSIKNQIDRLNGTVGEYLVYHVREDFCYDPEDGGTRNLQVQLRSNELVEIDEGYWLQFDPKNQEFFGLPMGVESREFVLVCSDKGGKSANDVLELQITPPRTPQSSYYTEFSINFQSIPFTPKAIRKFIEKLSSLLSPHIQVHSYSESNSHVLFKYFNTTNPSSEQEVTEIRKVLLSDDGPVSKALIEHFTPEFNVSVVSVVPLRGLLSENNPVVVGGGGMSGGQGGIPGIVDEEHDGGSNNKKGSGGGGRYFDFDSGEDNNLHHHHDLGRGGSGGGGGGKLDIETVNVDNYSGYLTTYIIPSVLIAIMILLALIIACLLSRKNKYTQASTEDDSSSPNSRVYLKNAKKGVPVIFQDELDEKQMFNDGQGTGGRNGSGTQQQRGNIYEQQQPTPPIHHHHHNIIHSTTTTPQNTTPSRLTSPTPSNHNRYNNTNTSSSHQPLPPDYQNSISRSMMRQHHQQRQQHLPHQHHQISHHHQHHNPPPPGGIPVYPDPYRSPPPLHHNQQQSQYQIDSYQPPPGINYYGIHNSNSGGSGFSERTSASGIIGGGGGGGQQTPVYNQHQHHHSGGGGSSSNNSNKMAPPPYVPP